jgi:hypothetical protein
VTTPAPGSEAPRPPGRPQGPPHQAVPPGQPPPAGRAGVPGPPPAPPPVPAVPAGAGPAAARPPRRLATVVALGVAFLALLVAAVSAVVAVRAGADARAARDLAIALRAGSTGASPAPTAAEPTVPDATGPAGPEPVPTDPHSTGEPPISSRTTYASSYEKEPLVLTVPSCGRTMAVDLDEPRVNVDASREVTMYQACLAGAPYTFELADGVDGTTEVTRDSTPQDCREKIRQAPVGPDIRIPVRKGVVVCLTTSYAEATGRGDKWRVVRFEVTALSGGAATIEATAWSVE